MIHRPNFVRLARQAAGLSTTDAAHLVLVTRRTFELWESSDQHPIPPAKLELFLRKIKEIKPSAIPPRNLVVVIGPDQSPIDVVAEDTFLKIQQLDANTAMISSMASDRLTGRPYVHETAFHILPDNEHVIEQASKWRSPFTG